MFNMRIYYWVHHTGQYDGLSGVQRVVRSLGRALLDRTDVNIVPVRWCPDRETIVHAEPQWLEILQRFHGPRFDVSTDSGEPLHLSAGTAELDGAWLLIPEVPHVGGGAIEGPPLPLVIDYARFYKMKVAAIFYDLIPIRTDGYVEMKDAHAAYSNALATMNCVIPISQAASDDLGSWWHEERFIPGWQASLRPVLLPAEMSGTPRVVSVVGNDGTSGHNFLMFGTIEARKNQVAVMKAFNAVARRNPSLNDLHLDIVGHLHPLVSADFHAELLKSKGRIAWHQYLSDERLRNLLTSCSATIFASLSEGYGLPVAESLWLGKPCITSDVGSMREIALGGGCHLVDPSCADDIEAAIERLAKHPTEVLNLTHEARTRPLSTWADYASDVVAILRDTRALKCLVIIEGSRGGGKEFARFYRRCGISVRPLFWSEAANAILPGFSSGFGKDLAPGDGILKDIWALVPYSTLGSSAEALQIEFAARGLGLRVALLVENGFRATPDTVPIFATVDLAIFLNTSHREVALATAFKTLSRIATLRQRMLTAASLAEIPATIASVRDELSTMHKIVPPKRLYYYCGMTATQDFNTGVQRVARQLCCALLRKGVQIVPIKYDMEQSRLVQLSGAELACLALYNGPTGFAGNEPLEEFEGQWLLISEIVVPSVPARSNLARYAKLRGFKVASICYDMIPFKMKDIYSDDVRKSFEPYWDMIAESDIALTISWSVAADLRRYIAEKGGDHTAIIPCPLAGELPNVDRQTGPLPWVSSDAPLQLLTIGTREPRKNHLGLLNGLKKANAIGGRPIKLTIVGRHSVFPELEIEIARSAHEAGNVDLRGHVSDEELSALIDASHVTILPSTEEGFGLPVLESLWRARPCIAHSGSALAEIAPGGGVLSVNMSDADDIALSIRRLADDNALLTKLHSQAISRSIRKWDEYADDVIAAIGAASVPKSWPLPAISAQRPRPLLTCAITTYNRVLWLKHSLPRLIETARPFGHAAQIVVCDNASMDATADLVARFSGTPNFKAVRNPVNVGMLGNLGVTARASDGSFIWLLGDDDIVLDGAIEAILNGIERHPDVEMVYLNYLYSLSKSPAGSATIQDLVQGAKPISYGGPNKYVRELREVAAFNENLFSAIYACVFRRDHALRGYQIDTRGPAFSSMATCIPSSVYALQVLQRRPAFWVGRPAVLINMNVSWLRWALLWHLERMPDLFNAAELAGIDPNRIDIHRIKHCFNAGDWSRAALFDAEDEIRERVSVQRLIERCKHLPEFRSEIKKIYRAYTDAYERGRLSDDDVLPPSTLFDAYAINTAVP